MGYDSALASSSATPPPDPTDTLPDAANSLDGIFDTSRPPHAVVPFSEATSATFFGFAWPGPDHTLGDVPLAPEPLYTPPPTAHTTTSKSTKVAPKNKSKNKKVSRAGKTGKASKVSKAGKTGKASKVSKVSKTATKTASKTATKASKTSKASKSSHRRTGKRSKTPGKTTHGKTPGPTYKVYDCAKQEGQRLVGEGCLGFDARFEGGNLGSATRVGPKSYELAMSPDVGTLAHAQWFYFSIVHGVPGETYRFALTNFIKPDSTFNKGQRPVMYSVMRAESEGIGWTHVGEDIVYAKTKRKRPGTRAGYYYQLCFSLTIPPYAGDTLYLAHSYPYTYTMLKAKLHALSVSAQASLPPGTLSIRSLTRTLAGNPVPVLHISQPRVSGSARKRGVVLMARVHPGETVSSWIMEGVLDRVLDPGPVGTQLRDSFDFLIIPMLNPDGVIRGNYRCSLAGLDLNRQWKEPYRGVAPSIFAAKAAISAFAAAHPVELAVDLHGHSRAFGVFMYGCQAPEGYPGSGEGFGAELVFPRLMFHASPVFSYASCAFKVSKAKESTARVVLAQDLDIPRSYTLESTFAGAKDGPLAGFHLSTHDLKAVGNSLCSALVVLGLGFDQSNLAMASVLRELAVLERSKETGNSDDGGDTSDDGSAAGSSVKTFQRRKKVPRKGKAGKKGGRKKVAGKKGNGGKKAGGKKVGGKKGLGGRKKGAGKRSKAASARTTTGGRGRMAASLPSISSATLDGIRPDQSRIGATATVCVAKPNPRNRSKSRPVWT